MLKLLDYNYYRNSYRGDSIPLSDFEKYCLDSSTKINLYTSNRINETNIDDNIKNATCRIIDLLYEQAQLKSKINDDKSSIASETVGPRSQSYVNKSNLQAQRILSNFELSKECYRICYEHLAQTGLMYRGGR